MRPEFRPPEGAPDVSGATAPRPPGVLLVDDRPANLVALEALLAPLGARLVRATSGREALARLSVDEYALVVLDVEMPALDGLETLARLRQREHGEKTPVLFVTAAAGDPDRVARAYGLGAVDFIAKPIDPAVLRAKVAVFLDLYEARERVRRQAALLRAKDLAASERKYRFLADATPEIVWTETPDGGVTYVNRRFVEHTGMPAERALGNGWWSVLHPDDRRLCLARRDEAARDGTPFELEYRLRRHDGAYRWFLARALPRRDGDGAVVEWVGTATDIDDRKRAEAEREELFAREREARALAEEASRAKDEFLAFVSHELRAPLNAILGWSQILRADGLGEEKRRRALEVIETNAGVQAKLIDDLLDVGRITAGKLRLQVGPTPLAGAVRAALDLVRPAAEAKGIALAASLDDVGEVQGDEGRLQQVAATLLSNAVKFTPEGGRVAVRLGRRGAHVELSVEDNGRGIAPEFLPHVFDRFRQADGAGGGGLGLGLSVVKSLVELHGGTVRAESEGPGRGARFAVLLPAAPAPRPGEPPASAAPPVPPSPRPPSPSSPSLQTPVLGIAPPPGREARARDSAAPPSRPSGRPPPSSRHDLDGARLLVVDDDPDARYFIASMLRSHGAEVATAESAHEAFYLFQRTRPDVLISDISMPNEDGCSLVRNLRRLAPEGGGLTPAVALTALDRIDDRTRALLAGFTMYLTKPTTAGEFVAVLSKLIEHTRTR
ncbi:MAG TPA: response regulator [Polyangiaceae bacterium]|nr:response regulator [Polyangiaceae bacterium]